jgi:hypothetical protein
MRFCKKLGWVLCVPLVTAGSPDAFAGAWTQARGEGRAIITGSYYGATDFYTNHGSRQSQPRYSKYELNPYIEYGLYDDVTLGANLSLQRAAQQVPGGAEQTNWGVGESEFFLRKRLYQHGGLVASVEPMVKLPTPDSGGVPKLGGPHADVGLGGSVGYGQALFGYNHFANVDTQYRHRLGAQHDQVRISATLGVGVAPQWVLMPQLFMTYRMAESATFTQSTADDYNLTRLQLSGVYSMTEDTRLQAGAFADVDGKNAGVGRGVLFSVWKNF